MTESATTNWPDSRGKSDAAAPLRLLETALAAFEAAGINYCHWKSNYHIAYALSGKEDVDLLIREVDFPAFARVLLDLGFKQADSASNRLQPGVFHFLGNDPETGVLINVHAYTRILTGDHFMKSWALPFEELLLHDAAPVEGISLPSGSSELIIFVVRNMIKYTTVFDCYRAMRSEKQTIEEREWLIAGAQTDKALDRLDRHLPEVDPEDFKRAMDLLGRRGRNLSKVLLGFRFARRLRKYRRYAHGRRIVSSLVIAARMAANKFLRKEKHMHFLTGGKIIAFVGPQATGKSTLVRAVRDWLGAELAVSVIHAGKPPATWLTYLPNRLIPLARSLMPGKSTVKIEIEAENDDRFHYPLIFLIRKLMLAHDRRALLRAAFRKSRNGKIVVSDRYPSDKAGAIDSRTFPEETIASESSALKRYLMRKERDIYAEICPPDLVLQLTVSVEEAIKRNKTRIKDGKQTTEYVIARHSQKTLPEFRSCRVVSISTERGFGETLLETKSAIWRAL